MELKPCPFCGTIPYLEKRPLWSGSHGYHGCYIYDIHCEKCGCYVNLGRNDTIYITDEEAKQNAINAWNQRVAGVDTVKHGRWEEVYGGFMFECSECHAQTNSLNYKGNLRYCHNCGAKMDLNEETGT